MMILMETDLVMNKLDRRTVIGGVLASGVVLASPSYAMSNAQAEKLVDQVVTEINRIISSGASESRMLADFEKLFVDYADVPTIARYALGRDARAASSAQMRDFTTAFTGYVSRKYGRRFREFIGGKISVNGAKPVKSFFEVSTTAYLSGQSPFEVTFLVSDKGGRPMFFNMFIEGINLLLTERAEIGAMLDKRGGNLNKLISDLQSI